MEAFIQRVLVGGVESVLAGVAIGAVLALVRRVQLSLGVRDDKGSGHIAGVR